MHRRFDGLFIQDIGYIPRKSERVNWVFPTFNYSIILSGHGSYTHKGRTIEIASPCVITQFPGHTNNYGPLPTETWEELYFVLPPEKLERARSKRLLGDEPHHWPIRNIVAVTSAIRALFPLIESSDHTLGKADRIDHQAERVIMETLLPSVKCTDSGSEAVKTLAQEMIANPERTYNYEEFAHDFGVSYSTFQRRWRDIHEVPPAQYLINLRISECCRLMAETDLKITEIARRIGFEDTAYYSRIFKQRIGVTPTEYRALRTQT